jgi:hypothetical protein
VSCLLNIGAHGIGDCILSLQISHFLKLKGVKHTNLISARKEVFNPLSYFFKNDFDLQKIDEKYSHENGIISNPLLLEEIKMDFNGDDVTYNVPDLLFRNPLSLDCKKHELNIQLIKKTRTIPHRFIGREKLIYCGLCSTTDGYVYKNIPLLIKVLAEFLPDYTIYFPLIKEWDRKIDNLGNFNINFPTNVLIHQNPTFEESLDFLKRSYYGVFTCNGPSHLAYQLGVPRLVLDPQFNKIPWMSRWKEDYEECIDINTQYSDIVNIIVANVRNPETILIDRKKLLELIKNGYNNWKNVFLLKY